MVLRRFNASQDGGSRFSLDVVRHGYCDGDDLFLISGDGYDIFLSGEGDLVSGVTWNGGLLDEI